MLPHRQKTYRRRKARTRPENVTASSPLPVIDREQVSYSEMSYRMLKRARHSGDPPLQKRTRRSDSTEVFGYDPTDPSSYQTPLPSPPAPSNSVVEIDRLSPVPVARSVMSRRTSSRNFKENRPTSRSTSRGLASPFHSRPGSATSSPNKKKRKPKKARTLSDTNSQPQRRSKESASHTSHTLTLKHSRNTSGPNLQDIPPSDWLVPPKALSSSISRGPLVDISPYAYTYDFSPIEKQIGSEHFFQGIAHSTPLPSNSKHDFMDHDVDMEDITRLKPARRVLQFNPDSLFQSPDRLAVSLSQKRQDVDAEAAFVKHSLPPQGFALPSSSPVDSPPDVGYILPAERDAGANLQELFDNLDLDVGLGTQDPSPPDCSADQAPAPAMARTRSLDSPASIRQRKRASTIKASDFPSLPPPSFGRRTRSGTVTQRTFSASALPLSLPGSSSSPDRGSGGAGRGMRRTRSGTVTQRKVSLGLARVDLPVHESDESAPGDREKGEESDKLLLKDAWPDEDWMLCREEGEVLEVVDYGQDELDMFKAGEPW